MVRKPGARPRELKPTVRRLITYRAITQRQLPREFLANELIKEITELGEVPPTLETAKRYISKARTSKNPLDQPWSLASCSQYPAFFPPEAIPTLIDCKNELSRIQLDEERRRIIGHPLSDISIRDAMWLIRLKPTIDHLSPELMIENEPLPSTYPFVIANTYAFAEMTSEILAETHFNSTELDELLFSGDINAFIATAARKISRSSNNTIQSDDKEHRS